MSQTQFVEEPESVEPSTESTPNFPAAFTVGKQYTLNGPLEYFPTNEPSDNPLSENKKLDDAVEAVLRENNSAERPLDPSTEETGYKTRPSSGSQYSISRPFTPGHSARPSYDDFPRNPKKIFDVDEVLEVIKEVTESIIQDSAYLHTRVSTWNTAIVSTCVKRLCGLNKDFKYIVTCTIVQKTDAGLHSTSFCFWDARCDGYAKYHNPDLKNMDVVVNVFGLAV
ncbi:hypothetical protein G9A89_006675 [Geosiphon pyriformis]|nr:hypothetical protein G9A89_006675 [Geosiphon pyriformis]